MIKYLFQRKILIFFLGFLFHASHIQALDFKAYGFIQPESSIYINKNLKLKQLNGKKLSYNNYNDIFAALNICKSLPKNQGTVIIKHANPCGVAVNSNKIESFKLALKSVPISVHMEVLLVVILKLIKN